MATWGEFEAAAPAIAAAGRQLIYRTETGQGLLATVRGAAPPRVHPIYVAVIVDRLVAFIIDASPKAVDLAEDGRFALHAHQDPAVPDEFLMRGRARAIDDEAERAPFAAAWYFQASDEYRLFEFHVEHAVHGARGGPDDWPPRYTSWRSAAG